MSMQEQINNLLDRIASVQAEIESNCELVQVRIEVIEGEAMELSDIYTDLETIMDEMEDE